MKCEDIRKDIDAFVDGELERERDAAVRDHVSACEACAGEVSERRSFSASLARSFDRALEGVEATEPERRRAADRLASVPRGRSLQLARLAAVLAIGLAIGLVASILFAPGPDPDVVAREMGSVRVMDDQLVVLRQEAKDDLDAVRKSVPEQDSPAASAANVALWTLEKRFAPPAERPSEVRRLLAETASDEFDTRSRARAALAKLEVSSLDRLRESLPAVERYDRKFVAHLIRDLEDRTRSGNPVKVEVSRVTGDAKVIVTQHADGSVRVVVPGRVVNARNMTDLRRRHAELCRKHAISGGDGAVIVGGNRGAVDLKDRIQLVFRTGAWDDNLLGEAYQAWVSGSARDGKEIQKRWQEFHDRFQRARQERPLPPVKVDMDSILRNMHELNGRELRSMHKKLQEKMKALDVQLKEARELRSRARALRTYAERLKDE